MQKKTFLIILLVLIYAIFILDLFATRYSLYFRFWWFDIMMHFLGGFWIATASYYFFYFSDFQFRLWLSAFKKLTEKYSALALTLASIILVGVCWELFEYVIGAVPKTGYALDTGLDLVMDLIGWSGACLFFSKIGSRKMVGEKIV
ncbi:MAG: hypothetical protein ABIG87_02985 [Patescibacteria group bacterium]